MIDEDDIGSFNWQELHDKTVRVLVYEDEGFQCAALYEPENEEFFIVSVKPTEEKK